MLNQKLISFNMRETLENPPLSVDDLLDRLNDGMNITADDVRLAGVPIARPWVERAIEEGAIKELLLPFAQVITPAEQINVYLDACARLNITQNANFRSALERGSETVDLRNNSIGDEGAIALAEALKSNRTITNVNLGWNSIGIKGAIALAEALKVNKTIKEINLWHNSIGDEGALALAEALKANNTIEKINLGANSIGDEGATAIARALEANKTIKEIILSVNAIRNIGARALAKALEVNETITNIALEDYRQPFIAALNRNRTRGII